MITRLKINNFRQFANLELNFEQSQVVILLANNTRGKSTILESIHFATNLDSPFTSKTADMIRQDAPDKHLRVEIDSFQDDKPTTLAVFQQGNSKKYIRDGSNTTRKKYNEQLRSTIFSPEQIEHLMISPSRRRDFLDSLISQIEIEYTQKLTQQRKILRQRNAYLKKLAKQFYENGVIKENDAQLEFWTESYAQVSAEVMHHRAQYINKLYSNEVYLEYLPSFESELDILNTSLEELFADHLNTMAQKLKRDIATGVTNIGAHRDDWNIHAGKDIQKYGSRGEKRMAIGRMILKNQEILSDSLGKPPILLLDDISSELDNDNIEKILSEAISHDQQIFISTIRLEGFPVAVTQQAKIIELD